MLKLIIHVDAKKNANKFPFPEPPRLRTSHNGNPAARRPSTPWSDLWQDQRGGLLGRL